MNKESDADLKDLERRVNQIHKTLRKTDKPNEIMELFTLKKLLSTIEGKNTKERKKLLIRILLEEIMFDMRKFRYDHFDFLEIRNLLNSLKTSELFYVIYLYYLASEFISKKYFRIAKTLIEMMKMFLDTTKDIASKHPHESYSQDVLEQYLIYVLNSIEKTYLIEVLKCYKSLVADPNLKQKLTEIAAFDAEKSQIFKQGLRNYQELEILVISLHTREDATKLIDDIIEINGQITNLEFREEFEKINEVFYFEVKLEEISNILLRGNLYFDLIGFVDDVVDQLEVFQTASEILVQSLEELQNNDIKVKIMVFQKIVWAIRCIITVRQIINVKEKINGVKIDSIQELVPKLIKFGDAFTSLVEVSKHEKDFLESYFDVFHFLYRICKQYSDDKKLRNYYARKMAATMKRFPSSGEKYISHMPMKVNLRKRDEESLVKFILEHDHTVTTPICSIQDLRRIFGV